jgi:hypothetical protein
MPADDGKMTIEASRLGLPATATSAEIRDKAHGLVDELKTMSADRDKWRERAEENQRALVDARKATAENREMKGELLIQAARSVDKIDESEVEWYRELYKESPELCAKRLEGLRERKYLRTQESLKGPIGDPPDDAVAEATALVAQKLANNKELKEPEAFVQLWREQPKLKERYFEAKRAAKAGGDR